MIVYRVLPFGEFQNQNDSENQWNRLESVKHQGMTYSDITSPSVTSNEMIENYDFPGLPTDLYKVVPPR
jgi:hypothetical protein